MPLSQAEIDQLKAVELEVEVAEDRAAAAEQEAADARARLTALTAALVADAPPPPPPAPTIASFTATPSTVTAGQSVTLAATFANGSATLDGAAWDGGARVVTPPADQTFALVVAGAAGTTPALASVSVTVTPVVVVPLPPAPTGRFKTITRASYVPGVSPPKLYWEPPEPAAGDAVKRPAVVSLHASSGGYNSTGFDLIGAPTSNSGPIFTGLGDASMGIDDNVPTLWNVCKARAAGQAGIPVGAAVAWNDPRYYVKIQPRSVVFNAGLPIETNWLGYQHIDPANPTAPKRAHPYEIRKLDALMAELYGSAEYDYIDRNRIAGFGQSMGAWGAAWYCLRHPELFSVAMLDLGVFSGLRIADWESKTFVGMSPAAGLLMDDGATKFSDFTDTLAYIKNPANPLPPVLVGIGRNDGYGSWPASVAAFKALLARDDVFVGIAWTDGNHGTQPRLLSLLPYDWANQFDRSKGYPILRQSSLDTGSLGDGTLAGSSPAGKFNDGFAWSVVTETPTAFALSISNRLGAVTVNVRPSSKVFPCAGVPFQTVSIPAGQAVTVNFDLPSSGNGAPDGGVTPAPDTTPPAVDSEPLIMFEQLNLGAVVLLDVMHFIGQYEREINEIELTTGTLRLRGGRINFLNGGDRSAPLAHERYALMIAPQRIEDGRPGEYVARAWYDNSTPSAYAQFDVTLGPEDGCWAFTRIAPFDAQGNPIVGGIESFATFPVILNRSGQAKDWPWLVKHDSTHTIVKCSNGRSQLTIEPTAWCELPPPARPLTPIKPVRPTAERVVSDFMNVNAPFQRWDLETQNKQIAAAKRLVRVNLTAPTSPPPGGNDLFLPCKTESGVWVCGGVQSYYASTLVTDAFLNVHAKDGPRGVGQIGFPINAWLTERTDLPGLKLFVNIKNGTVKIDPAGTITTITGLRIKNNIPRYASNTVLQDAKGKPYAQHRVIGDYEQVDVWDGDPATPLHERVPDEPWFGGFIPESLPLDLTAPLIGGESPHKGNPTLLTLDRRGFLFQSVANGRDRSEPFRTRLLTKFNGGFGGALYNGGVIVAEERSGRLLFCKYDGTIIKVLHTARGLIQGIDVLGVWCYFGVFGPMQVWRINLVDGTLELCRQLPLHDHLFINPSVSDGSIYPAHTLFVPTFSDEAPMNYNSAFAYLPFAGVENGVAQTHLQTLAWHGPWAEHFEGGGGVSASGLYPTKIVARSGVIVKLDSTYGVGVLREAYPGEVLPDLARAGRGAAKAKALGWGQAYGHADWMQRGGPGPKWGIDADIDCWRTVSCGSVRPT